jgi:hypothetical protein
MARKKCLTGITLVWMAFVLVSCSPEQSSVTIQPMISPSHTPTIMPIWTIDTAPTDFLTKVPTPTAVPTPVYSVARYKLIQYNDANLYKFDPDVYPPIVVSHNPPLIARSDEVVKLVFDFVCAYIGANQFGSSCNPKATLYISYDVNSDFTPSPLSAGIENGMEAMVADLPASDDQSRPLRYFLRINDPKINLEMGYPLGGAIEVFSVPTFIQVELSAQNPVQTGELVLALPWGSGPRAVGIQQREGYPQREGPVAIAVAEDGKIALLDHVNGRVLIYDSNHQTFNHIPLPFVYKSPGDMLQFDRDGKLAIFDPFGEPTGGSRVNIPRLYLMNLDGSVNIVAPVFAASPIKLAADLQVFDIYDFRWVEPIGPTGEVRSREAQRLKQNPEFPYRFVENQDPYVARLGDAMTGLAFEVRSATPLGGITDFEKTPQGYVVIFGGDQIRAIWFDPSGKVLKDVTLANNNLYSEIDLYGQMAIDQDGSLYVLGSTEKGVEVRFVKAP